MKGKRTIVLLAFLLISFALVASASDSDADRAFSSEVSYFDGYVIVQGTVPEAYANEQSHVEIEVHKTSGDFLAEGFAEPTSEGIYKQMIKVPLSKGQYQVEIDLLGSGQQTVKTTKELTIDDSTVVEVESISISPSSKELIVGETVSLICTINPVTATDQYVTWASSNSSVASVDQDGKVTANSAGTAVITVASIGGKEATCTIAVKSSSSGGSSESTSMAIAASSYTLYAGGDSVTLTANYPSSIGADSLRWSVSPSSYAAFTESSTVGKTEVHLEGKATGTVTVTLTSVASSDSASVRISVIEKPDSDYSFFLRMDLDYDKADFGTSGYSAADLKEGITLTGSGSNAGVALESALRANGIPCHFWSGGELRYWVNDIFGLGDYHYSNGDWKYWIQYQIIDGKQSYNQWTLGYYTDGGSFNLIYGITKEDGQVVKPADHEDDPTKPDGPSPTDPDAPDIPTEHLDPTDPDADVTTDTKENDDGSTTEIVTITKENDDGSVTTTVIDTTTQKDGSSETIETTTNSKTDENGVRTDSSLDTVTIKDAEGNIVSETEITSTTVDTTSAQLADSSGISITAEDKDGNAKVIAEAGNGSDTAVVVTEVKPTEENGKVTVSEEALDTALMMQEMYSDRIVGGSDKDSDKTVQIGSSSGAPLVLSKDAVAAIADSGADLRFVSGDGSVIIPNGVLAGLSDEEEIEISVIYLEKADLEGAQKDAVSDDSTLVDITIVSGERNLGLDLGGTITVIVKHDSEDGKKVAAYYVADDGSKEKVRSSYDSAKGEVSLYLTHCSVYEIANEEPSGSSDEEDNTTLYIIIAVVAIAIIAVAAVMILRRH